MRRRIRFICLAIMAIIYGVEPCIMQNVVLSELNCRNGELWRRSGQLFDIIIENNNMFMLINIVK